MHQSYRTDLTEQQWEILSQLIPEAKPGGRPRTVDVRGVVNGILYVLVAGCAWSLLLHDFPKWKTVYHYTARTRRASLTRLAPIGAVAMAHQW